MLARIGALSMVLSAALTLSVANFADVAAQSVGGPTKPFEYQKLPRLKLVEELRLDAAAEDFSAIRGVSVSRLGTIAVRQGQDLQIRLYDSTGKRITVIGRKGEGPGEFQNVSGVSWVGDTLFVLDMALNRVSYFGTTGKLLRSVVIPNGRNTNQKTSAADTNFRSFSPYSAFSNGTMIGEARLSVGATWSSSQNVLVTLSPANVFRLVAKPPSYDDERWMMWNNGFGYSVPLALRPQINWSSDGSKIAILTGDQRSTTGKFYIVVFDAGGKTLYDKAFSYRGTPIPASVADSEINESFPLKVAAVEGPPNSQWQTLARKRLPATFSLVERIVIGSDGRAWITLRATSSSQDAVVFDAGGTPAAVAALPKNARIEQANTSHVWVTQRDADGLPSVVRYRVLR